eukprot:TRINITY_DN38984_c0_g1_i1.p3 TRINITY_DN38984_c0_g1~~TRINITY_DN38984_c0_g1_i1.p3  ORF type:complete len:122 (+),score=13.95 TRINITY_DN38984_c0_g1_i1:131-496(+)
MIRRPPRSTQGVSSAASDVYKRQVHGGDYPMTLSSQPPVNKATYKDDKPPKTKPPQNTHNTTNTPHLLQLSKSRLSTYSSNLALSPVLQHRDTALTHFQICLLYTSPSPRDLSTSRMPSSA